MGEWRLDALTTCAMVIGWCSAVSLSVMHERRRERRGGGGSVTILKSITTTISSERGALLRVFTINVALAVFSLVTVYFAFFHFYNGYPEVA